MDEDGRHEDGWHEDESMVFVDGGRHGFEFFSGFRMRVDGVERANELPHPGVTVLIQFGDVVQVGDNAADHRAVVVGLTDRPTPTRRSGAIDCVEVRISPLAAFSLLGGVSMAELSREPLGLVDVLGVPVNTAFEEAATASTWDERFEIVNRLFKRGNTRHEVDAEVCEAWTMLESSGGTVRVKELCEETGWSENRLRKRFQTQIGLTPKRAGRLIRFDRANRLLKSGQAPAVVAARCGFVDQSHLHREVRAFAGMTPAELGRGS